MKMKNTNITINTEADGSADVVKKKSMNITRGFAVSVPVMALLFSLQVHAFSVNVSRVVLNGTKPTEVSVINSNKSDGVLLIKAVLTPQINVPGHVPGAMVSPPVARLDAGGTNTVRVMVVDPSKFPADRESKFFISISGMAATNPLSRDRTKLAGTMGMGTGHILKVLYRPSGLPELTQSTWRAIRAVRVPAGVDVTNPTPFWLTFGELKVDGMPASVVGDVNGVVMPPFSHQVYVTRSVAKKTLDWQIINDMGGYDAGKTDIQ